MNFVRGLVSSLVIIFIKWETLSFDKVDRGKVFNDVDPKIQILENNEALWNLLSKMFKYEESVTVLCETYSGKDQAWQTTFVRLLSMNFGLPLTVIEGSSQNSMRAPTTNDKEINYGTNTNTSYILLIDDVTVLPHLLALTRKTLITWHSRVRFVVVTYDSNLPEIQQIFQYTWKIYGISRAVGINLIDRQVAVYDVLKNYEANVVNITDIEQPFAQRRYGLQGYPIRVLLMHSPPMSIAIPNSTRFQGVNQMIIDTLAECMNFTAVMCKPTYFDEFGNASDSGKVTNAMKQVINREVDLDASTWYITKYEGTGYEFTTPFFSERIHVVVPQADRVPIWLAIYRVFDDEVWIPTAILFALCAFIWICVWKFHVNSHHRWDVGLMMIHVFFLLTGHPLTRQSDKLVKRLLVVCASIFAIIFNSCLTGHLIHRFSTVVYYPKINNLGQLNRSGLPLVRDSNSVMSALHGTENALLKDMLKRVDKYSNVSTAFDLKDGVLDHAVFARLTRIKYEKAKRIIENNGTNSLHMMKQSLGKFSMAYIVPKGFTFLGNFNFYINRILEAGLIKKWYNDVIFNFQMRMQRAQLMSAERIPRPFTISDFALAWSVLVIGLTIGFVTFLVELCLK